MRTSCLQPHAEPLRETPSGSWWLRLAHRVVPYHWGACIKTCGILMFRYGHWRTARTWSCIDATGAPIPWYTYPAIEYLKQLDFQARTVFEYGLGNSTYFWGGRARQVVSVENDPAWFDKIAGRLPANCTARLETDGSRYARAIEESPDGFDVIVIDGRWREACVRHALPCLRTGGLVILDNADHHPDCAALLRGADLIQVDMSGFGPIGANTWTTSLFFHRSFRIPPLGPVQPMPGIGSISLSAQTSRLDGH